MSHPIPYAVIGLGRAGWSIHVDALRKRTDAKVVAVVDPLEERRKQAESELGCRSHTQMKDVLNADDIEVVVVATPSSEHVKDTLKVLKAGKHVVVEKPFAGNAREGRKVLAAAQAAGKQVFVHHNYIFNPQFTYLRQLVDSGKLGRIYHIRHYQNAYYRRNDWQTLRKNNGGHLNNHGTHVLYQVLDLLGEPVQHIMGDLQHICAAGDAEDHVKVLMRTATGKTADIEVTLAQNLDPLPQWILCGQYGTAFGDATKFTIRWYDHNQAPPLQVMEGAVANRAYGNTDQLPWQQVIEPMQGPNHGDFYDNVFAVLRQGAPMRVTLTSALETVQTIDRIRKGTAFV